LLTEDEFPGASSVSLLSILNIFFIERGELALGMSKSYSGRADA
jgi:hypothetical protein